MKDTIYRQDAIDAIADYIHNVDKVLGRGKLSASDCKNAAESVIEELPSVQPVKAYTKADYIMALHKEYGCTLTMAEEAHNKALEHLRSKARMKG